tara:strand:- start:232 stop:705 length:474 start_codon:yes stop_codon:yes gene_type:complete
MWEDGPHARFWRQLIQQQAREFMRNREYLQTLRTDYEEARRMQKRFGHVWAEYGTDIYKLTAEACGENWDSEDEEKNAFARAAVKKEAAVKQKHDNLAPARQASSRRGLNQLQGISQESECVLEEDKGRSKRQEESPKKEARQERRADFYRRAGGTC